LELRRLLMYMRKTKWGLGLETERKNVGISFYKFYSMVFKQYVLRSIALRKQRKEGVFTSIQIETWGFCNRSCSFCFNSTKLAKRGQGIMSDETWAHVMDQLGKIHYKGRISLHFYGEPLLDKRIPNLVEYARKACPDAFLHFSTNGDMLTEDLLRTLIEKGFTHLTITDYEEKPQDRLKVLAKKYPLHAMLRHQDDFKKINKAGMVLDYKTTSEKPCLRPAYQMVINWNGDAVLCCNDFYGRFKFGNINTQPLLEIWNSENFTAVRDALRKPGSRAESDLCKYCDDPGVEP
jgi:radical SAM protein with 4Fe4S-binding SPASM domain